MCILNDDASSDNNEDENDRANYFAEALLSFLILLSIFSFATAFLLIFPNLLD